MSLEKFNLSWNEFSNCTSKTFRSLLTDQDFTDVTLASGDGKQIKSHKVILSSCSPFFRRILLKNPHQNPLLYLKGVDYLQLQAVLHFMYLGQVEVAQENLEHFMDIAKDLEVKGLAENVAEPKSEYKKEAPALSLKPPNFYETQEVFETTNLVEEYTYTSNYSSELMDTNSIVVPAFENVEDHSKYFEKELSCNRCDFKFAKSIDLRAHKQSQHGDNLFECNQCSKICTNNSNLRRHKRSVHEGVTYSCDKCDYTTIYSFLLNTHSKAKHV